MAEEPNYKALFEHERELRLEAERRLNPTSFLDFLKHCHQLMTIPLQVNYDIKLTTKGTTAPKGRLCPLFLKQWDDFPALRSSLLQTVESVLHPSSSDPIRRFPSLEKLTGLGELFARRKLGSELDLMGYQRPRSDQLCVYRKDDGGHSLLYIMEYKAPHKITPDALKTCIKVSDFWEDIVQVHLIPTNSKEKQIYRDKQIAGAALTQTFDYMIKEGVEYGCLSTGEALVFLQIKAEDPNTLYYYLTVPKHDIEAETPGDNFAHPKTAIASLLSLSLLALGSERRAQSWRTQAAQSLRTWEIDVNFLFEKFRKEDETPDTSFSASSFAPSSPVEDTVDRRPETRATSQRAKQSCADEHDSTENTDPNTSTEGSEGDDPTRKGTGMSLKRTIMHSSPPSSPSSRRPTKRSTLPSRHRSPLALYCTQTCLAGLANQSPLDKDCPNFSIHKNQSACGRHPIPKSKVAELVDKQLNNDRDDGCVPLSICGRIGALFKMTLFPYGYTFVGKGTVIEAVHLLQHEARVYAFLEKMQGNQIPICFGAVDLEHAFIMDNLDEVVHYLLLSWAGKPLHELEGFNDEDSAKCKAYRRAQKKLAKALSRAGVIHDDLYEPNMLWNEESQQFVAIDFDRARLRLKKQPNKPLEVLRKLGGEPSSLAVAVRNGRQEIEDFHVRWTTRQARLTLWRFPALLWICHRRLVTEGVAILYLLQARLIDTSIELTSRTSKSWSPNTLRTRLVLNFKRIPYTQSFISYPDIAPILESLSVPPIVPQYLPYTLPAIIHKPSLWSQNPQHYAMNDSTPIALHLESAFPAPHHPSLFPTPASYPLAMAVLSIMSEIMVKQRRIALPKTVKYLDPAGQEYFNRTRSELFGQPLAELAATGDELERVWQDLAVPLSTLATMLRGEPGKQKSGPFFEGDKAGYADLVVVAFMAWFLRNDLGDWERIVAIGNGEFKRLWDACLPWVEGQGEEIEWEVPKQ
ncbi:conserved hypothetical protein [Uncinocarpus reesii 1704]|uniref:Glutathione S-transferase UstS-like C-terminal domain-containing protein n=1 Tax=Uncinocarpus reesii (strain UAMH 1704) TaxID=336963 RepID=C4JUM4_UNCRE|nr:uncharacterized protein UREG_04827 [Uncinocarpus reesii 1704]EEP79985.1 conserved hypothetical protein [Uncinocarpus reesii 1704]